VYLHNDEGKEMGRDVPLCSKAATSKWKTEQMQHALILKDNGTPAKNVARHRPRRNRQQSGNAILTVEAAITPRISQNTSLPGC
jgi:hypothetical protein